MFQIIFEKCNFLKYKLKSVCFYILKSYAFDKVDKNLSEVDSIASKNLIEHKDLVIQQADKANTVVITEYMKNLSFQIVKFPIDEDKWITILN